LIIQYIEFNLIFLSHDKVFRAFIPDSKVKWFDEKIRQTPEIDIWLSTRLLNGPLLNSTSINYKYFCEFKLKYQTGQDFEVLIELLKSNKIKLEVLIEDLSEKPDFSDKPTKPLKEKRQIRKKNERNNSRSVYKSFGQVNLKLLIFRNNFI